MACLDIRYKNVTFKITNGEQSDVFNTSDYNLLYDFLTSGKLPSGVYVEGDNIDRNSLFEYLCNELVNSKDNNELFIGFITDKSQDDFINKLVGNNSIDNIIDENSKSLDNNVLVVNSWGDSKNWYGFTDKRSIIITGDKFFSNRFVTRSLSSIYALARANHSRTINTIDYLYKKYNTQNTNIYKKLTWLSNHRLLELLSNTYTPNNSRYIPPKGKTINNILNNNISLVIGDYIKYEDNIYIIESNKELNSINVRNILTNNIESIDTRRINMIYKSIHIYHDNTIHYLIDNNWYIKEKSKFNILSEELSDTLFQEYFGITDNLEERVSVYNNNITGKSKLDGELLINKLQEGSKIRTASGIYTKTNGVFINGFEDLDPIETIYDIYINNDSDWEIVNRLKDFNHHDNILSPSDLRIILYDHFNIKDFSNIKFSYKNNSPVVFVTSMTTPNDTGQLELQPQLILKYNIPSNLDNYAEITLAVNFYNYLNTTIDIPSEVADVKKFWKVLHDVVILNKKNPYIGTSIENIINTLSENTSVDVNLLDSTLESNKQQLLGQGHNDLVEELIRKGLYIISCEL